MSEHLTVRGSPARRSLLDRGSRLRLLVLKMQDQGLYLLFLVPVALLLTFFFIIPLYDILVGSFIEDGCFTTQFFEWAIFDNDNQRAARITFELAVTTTLCCLVLGYPVAYYLATRKGRWRNVVLAIVIFSFLTNIIAETFSWRITLGRQGPINEALQLLPVIDEPFDLVFNRVSTIVAMVQSFLPFMILPLFAVMRGIPNSLLSVAQSLGASPFRSFLRVFLPLSMPGVATGSILVLILSAGTFIAPTLVGNWPMDHGLSSLIDDSDGYTMALTMLLLGAIVVVYLGFARFVGFGSLYKAGDALMHSTSGWSSHPSPRRWVVSAVVAFTSLFLLVPILVIVPLSFNQQRFAYFPIQDYNLRWIKNFFTGADTGTDWTGSAISSLEVAVLAVVVTVPLAVLFSYGLLRGRFPGKATASAIILAPLVIPSTVIGLALWIFYADHLEFLMGTIPGLAVPHAVLALPYAILILGVAFRSLDHVHEQAAVSLGANRWTVLRRIVLPQVLPGLVIAGLFTFLVSLDEVVIGLWLAVPGGFRTLPMNLWNGVTAEFAPMMAVVSTLVIVGAAIVLLAASYLRGRLTVQRQSPDVLAMAVRKVAFVLARISSAELRVPFIATLKRQAFYLALVLPALALLIVFLVLPLIEVLDQTFLRHGLPGGLAFSIRYLDEGLRYGIYPDVWRTTFSLAGTTVLGCLLLGYPVAYYLATSSGWRRTIVTAMVFIPFITSLIAQLHAWRIVMGRNGPVNDVLQYLWFVDEPFDLLFTPGAVHVAMIQVFLPFMILPLYAVMRGIPRSLTVIAEGLGASPLQAFFRVFLPLTLPGALAGAVLVFSLSAGSVVIPETLGSLLDPNHDRTIASFIDGSGPFNAGRAVLLLLFILVPYLVFTRYIGFQPLYQIGNLLTHSASAPDQRRGRYRFLLTIGAAAVCVFLLLPSLIVVPMAFNRSRYYFFPPNNYSLKWIANFFTGKESPTDWIGPTLTSAEVAGLAVLVSLTLGGLLSYALVRGRFPGRGFISAVALIPLIVPSVLFAASLYFFYSDGWDFLIGSVAGLVMPHAMLALPFVVLILNATLRSADEVQEFAAMTLGANRFTAFRRVILPQIYPGIIVAAVFAFLVSFNEVIIAFWLKAPGFETLPTMMWIGTSAEYDPMMPAVSTLLLLMVLAAFLVVAGFRKLLVRGQ